MTAVSARFTMPHAAVVCSGPQLEKVITELEAGTYPQPEDAIWRGDLPRDLAVRLAKATGATDEQIAEIEAEPPAGEPEPSPEPEPQQPAEPAPGCKRLKITHDHENGTLVHGTTKGDGVYELIGPRTAARFRYFPSIRMLGIAQSRDHLAKRWQIEMAAEALRKAGHVVTVEIDDTPRDVAEVKADRADRLDARAERLTAKAARLQAEGDARHAAADRISERFAGGQPILVGHHSERSARRDHKRMEQNDRAAAVAYGKAEHAAAAASVVGNADAYRERPGVIRRRIGKHEAELRQTMHRINGTRPANDWRGAYGYAPEPATGAYLEQCLARKAFLEHQLEADRAALAEHQANGYVMLTRADLHKGDRVHWGATWGDGVHGAIVTRVNPKTVTLNRRSYPRTLPYEQIKRVECPHEGTETTVRAPKRQQPERAKPEPVTVQRPPEREQPLEVDARFEFFPTPAAIAARMIDAAGIEPGMTVLEPSAGAGAIVAPLVAAGATVDTYELNMAMSGRLKDAGTRDVYVADFPTVPPRADYDAVLMNPPFGNRADVRHVLHALGFLRPGGRLVAIMSASVSFRDDKLTAGLRELIEQRGGTIETLPPDAFKASGTEVRTVLVTIPAAAPVPAAEPELPAAALAEVPEGCLF